MTWSLSLFLFFVGGGGSILLFDVEKPVAWRENLYWESILLKDIHLVVGAEISGSSVLGWVLVHQKAKWFSVEASTNEVSNKNDRSPLMVLMVFCTHPSLLDFSVRIPSGIKLLAIYWSLEAVSIL